MSAKQSRCACLIPFYNEAPRIAAVLKVVSRAKEVDEIVCVDDGSNDGTAEIVKEFFPHVRVYTLPINMGKTEAVRYGLKKIDSEYTMLLDADLRGAKTEELSRAVKIAQKKNYDMIVLRRVKPPVIPSVVKLLRGDILITGERIVRTKLIRTVLDQDIVDFQMELALNQYSLDNFKSVAWSPSSGVSIPWILKRKIVDGVKKEYRMFTDLLKYIGLRNYMRQYIYFCREKASM